MYKLISTYSLVKPPKGSNISGGEILNVLINIKDLPNVNDRKAQWNAQLDTILDRGNNMDILPEAVSILQEHNYSSCSTSEFVLTYVAGYIARKAARFAKFQIDGVTAVCENCIQSMQLSSSEEIPANYKLITLRSRESLINPSVALVSLISILEKAILDTLNFHTLNAETLFEVTKTIESISPLPFVGCPEHEKTLTHAVLRFFLMTRMQFICKQANKNTNAENLQTKERRKAAKLTYKKADSEMQKRKIFLSTKNTKLTSQSESCKQQKVLRKC